jgi:hypothetical protein
MPKHDPPLSWLAYRVAKDGNSSAENEDAFAADAAAGRFAVSDGASESAFAPEWADLLATSFVTRPGCWSGWLPDARSRWLDGLRDVELPWYLEEKFGQGAFATLLGVTVCPADGEARAWSAEAVGDTCLFQVRRDRLVRAFPVQRSSEFNGSPTLLGSRPCDDRTRRFRTRGHWRPGDRLLLMTDALACWFLSEVENGNRPWQPLELLADEEAFAGWLAGLRRRGAVRNDDVTALQIRTPSAG